MVLCYLSWLLQIIDTILCLLLLFLFLPYIVFSPLDIVYTPTYILHSILMVLCYLSWLLQIIKLLTQSYRYCTQFWSSPLLSFFTSNYWHLIEYRYCTQFWWSFFIFLNYVKLLTQSYAFCYSFYSFLISTLSLDIVYSPT